MISHIVVLSGFHYKAYVVQSIMITRFIFGVDCICTISHIVVLYDFHHNQHPIQLVTIVQYHFQHRPHLYDRSCHCPVWFLSQKTPGSINHDRSISFSMYTASLRLVTSLFSSQTTFDLIGHNNPILLLAYIALVKLIMSLSLLVVIRDHTQFNRSRQLSFYFCVD